MILTDYLIAVIPSVVILTYIYFRNLRSREPVSVLFRMFLLGMLITLPAAGLQNIWPIRPAGTTPWDLFLLSFLNVALIEESLKYIVFMRFIWSDLTHFHELYDGIVYAAFISLGFATMENIFYVMSFGSGTGVARAFTAVPLHAVCEIFMGVYLGRARFTRCVLVRGYRMIMGLLIPIVIHGLYNYVIFLRSPWLTFFVFPVLVVVYYFLGIREIRDNARR